MIAHDLVRTTLATVLRPGDAFADLFAERMTQAIYEIVAGRVDNARVRSEQGVGIRRIGERSSQHVHLPDISELGLAALVAALRDSSMPTPIMPVPPTQLTTSPVDEIVALGQAAAAEAERWCAGHSGTTVTTRVVVSSQAVLIGRSDGPIHEEVRDKAALHVEVVVRHERKVRKSRRSMGGQQIADLRADDRYLALARLPAEAALARLEAVAAPSGEMPVILGPGGPATLLHEACGHPLEADLAHHPGSAYYGSIGTRVAGPMVTVVDDPRAPDGAPLYHIDDEGVPAEATVLIERGILRDYLYDRRSAAQAGRATNGHARRLSYAYPPLPRMSTTYVQPGTLDPAEIIAATERGILVQSIAGGDTDMGSGRFNLQVDEGFLIEGGRISTPIRGAVLSGRGPEVLQAIDMVGNDCAFLSHGYLCNKLDQFPLVVSVGQPTLRVARMLVWGG